MKLSIKPTQDHKAVIEYAYGRHKKARHKTGLKILGSGGALCELYAD